MQFPPEAVREIAQLLSQSDLGEVSFEAGQGQRLTLKRRPKIVGVAPAFVEAGAPTLVVETVGAAPEAAVASDAVTVASPCVGIFHAAKVAIEVGAQVEAKQLVATVESLKVPNEIYAPAPGVVAQMWVSDGQGVEWGQPLFEIQTGQTP